MSRATVNALALVTHEPDPSKRNCANCAHARLWSDEDEERVYCKWPANVAGDKLPPWIDYLIRHEYNEIHSPENAELCGSYEEKP